MSVFNLLFRQPDVSSLVSAKDIASLIKVLRYKKSREIRAAAAEALSSLGDITAVDHLAVAAATDKDSDVRSKASSAIDSLRKYGTTMALLQHPRGSRIVVDCESITLIDHKARLGNVGVEKIDFETVLGATVMKGDRQWVEVFATEQNEFGFKTIPIHNVEKYRVYTMDTTLRDLLKLNETYTPRNHPTASPDTLRNIIAFYFLKRRTHGLPVADLPRVDVSVIGELSYFKTDGRTIVFYGKLRGLLKGSQELRLPVGQIAQVHQRRIMRSTGRLESAQLLIILNNNDQHEFDLDAAFWTSRGGGIFNMDGPANLTRVLGYFNYASTLFRKSEFMEDTLTAAMIAKGHNLSLRQAADAIAVSIGALKRYIESGNVRANPDGTIDVKELIRVGYKIHKWPQGTL